MVLLGYPDENPSSSDSTAFDNFIGGHLISFREVQFSPPKVTCPTCEESMTFILQLYCPVDGLFQHRVLFFFICLSSSCQIWRVFRQQFPMAKLHLESQIKPSTVSDWTFGEDSDEDVNVNLWNIPVYSTSDTGMDIIPDEPGTTYPCLHLKSSFEQRFVDVYDEEPTSLSEADLNADLDSWILDYKAEREFIEEDDNEIDENPPSVQFQLHLSTRSEYGCEVIRYSFGGQPIFVWPPKPEWVSCTKCPRCSSSRIFEVQLFSTLNNALKIRSESSTDLHTFWPLNMLTVIVFVCKDSCWHDSEDTFWVEECILVQSENGREALSN